MLNWTKTINKTVDQLLESCYNTHMNKILTSFERVNVLQKNNTFTCSKIAEEVDQLTLFCYNNDML
jgi:hypothetical protein